MGIGMGIGASIGTHKQVAPSGGGGLGPFSLATLVRYYDADDLAAGSPASWPGHAGVAPDVPAVVAPTVVAGALNGHKIATFSAATSQRMIAASGGTSLSGATAYTLVGVYRALSSGGSTTPFCLSAGTARPRITLGGRHMLFLDDSLVWGRTGFLGDDAWVRVVWRYDGTATGNDNRLRCRINGVDQVLDFLNGPIPASLSPIFSTETRIGGGTGDDFNGSAALFAIENYCRTDAQTTVLDAWLLDRFGPM